MDGGAGFGEMDQVGLGAVAQVGPPFEADQGCHVLLLIGQEAAHPGDEGCLYRQPIGADRDFWLASGQMPGGHRTGQAMEPEPGAGAQHADLRDSLRKVRLDTQLEPALVGDQHTRDRDDARLRPRAVGALEVHAGGS